MSTAVAEATIEVTHSATICYFEVYGVPLTDEGQQTAERAVADEPLALGHHVASEPIRGGSEDYWLVTWCRW